MKTLHPAPLNLPSRFKLTVAAPLSQGNDTGRNLDAADSSGVQKNQARHWLLDHYIGRDVLISQLRLSCPEDAPPRYVLRTPGLDTKLEPQIDALGYRYAIPPATQLEDLKVSFQLLGVFVKLEWKLFRSEIRQMRREGRG